MTVQAQYLAHAFPHDSRAIRPLALDNATSASVFLGEHAAAGHLLATTAQQEVHGNTLFSDLACNNNDADDSGCFVPRKRARAGDAGACLIMEGHGALLPQAFALAGDVQSRVLCSGAASTSGRPSTAAPAPHGLLSHLYHHSVEIDTLVRIQNERLRAGLQEARRRHARELVSAVERAAARRLRDAEAELERALARNVELGERLRQLGAEGQAWQGIARNHEAVAAGLRATLDQLLQPPCAGAAESEGDAEDARSCCFGQHEERAADRGVSSGGGGGRACNACGEAEPCVLLLPCRHLCLCRGCEAAVDTCPVCAATKNGSLIVLLS